MLIQRNIITTLLRYTSRKYSKNGTTNFQNMEKSRVKKQNKSENTRRTKYRQRVEQSGNKLKPPSNIYLQVLGSGNNCTTRSLLVDFATHKYLFNCTEGTQRVLGDRKLKLGRVENVFITKSHWQNISGLSGLHLTIDGTPVPVLKLCGPQSIAKFMVFAGSTADGRTTKLDITGLEDGFVEDEGMKTELIKVVSSSPDVVPVSSDKDVEPDTKRARTEDEKDTAIAYLCQPHPAARKVSVQRIMQLNIPRDRTIGQLVQGETVILPDGREIHPDDILEPELKELPFLVVECYDSSYLPSLNSCTALQQFYTDGQKLLEPVSGRKETGHSGDQDSSGTAESDVDTPQGSGQEQQNKNSQLSLVVHFTRADLIQEGAYQEWMKRFGSETKHLVINEWGSGLSLQRPYVIQTCLNQVHSSIFPLMTPHTQQGFKEEVVIRVDNVTIGHPGLTYVLRGSAKDVNKYNSESCPRVNQEEILAEVNTEEFQQEMDILQGKLKNLTEADVVDDRSYPEVVFLGTGSSVPSPARNVSSILVHLSPDACMLLDAGEDTAGQIRRFYADRADEVFCKLKAIFISHRHADHHMGVINVVLEREKCLRSADLPLDRILMVIPYRYRNFLENLDEIFHVDLMKKISYANAEYLLNETSIDGIKTRTKLHHLDLPISAIQTCKVNHRKDPFGLILTLENGFKLVYSGDTTPCEELVSKGKGCDLLIHEATMEDDLKKEARRKDHSTTSEAIEIGQQMGAKFTILTHFSQRYGKLPLVNENFHNRVAIAFDNMKVNPRELHILPLLIPAIKALWSEHYQQMETIQQVRNKRWEREKTELQSEESLNTEKVKEGKSETKSNESESTAGTDEKQDNVNSVNQKGNNKLKDRNKSLSDGEDEMEKDNQCKNAG